MASELDCSLSLSELVLVRVSPEEVPLVELIGPQLVSADGRQRADGSLGMGVDEFAWAVAVLPVANTVVAWLLEQIKEFASEEIGRETKSLLDWLRKRRVMQRGNPAEELPPPLPGQVARRIRKVAYDKARTAGIDDAKASLIADAVAGAVGVPTQPDATP